MSKPTLEFLIQMYEDAREDYREKRTNAEIYHDITKRVIDAINKLTEQNKPVDAIATKTIETQMPLFPNTNPVWNPPNDSIDPYNPFRTTC